MENEFSTNATPVTSGMDSTQTGQSHAEMQGGAFHDDETNAAFLGLMEEQIVAPDDISNYSFPYEPGMEELSPDAQAADMMYRTWLRDAEIPANIGSVMAKDVNEFVRRVADYSDAQHELEYKTTTAMLQRVWGDRTSHMINLARKLVAELDTRHGGRVLDFLESSGAGNCPELIVQLANHAERLALVKKSRRGQ
jgi:hypothetical protein